MTMDNAKQRWIIISGKSKARFVAQRYLENESWASAEDAWVALEGRLKQSRKVLGKVGYRVEVWRGQAHQGKL